MTQKVCEWLLIDIKRSHKILILSICLHYLLTRSVDKVTASRKCRSLANLWIVSTVFTFSLVDRAEKMLTVDARSVSSWGDGSSSSDFGESTSEKKSVKIRLLQSCGCSTLNSNSSKHFFLFSSFSSGLKMTKVMIWFVFSLI